MNVDLFELGTQPIKSHLCVDTVDLILAVATFFGVFVEFIILPHSLNLRLMNPIITSNTVSA